MSKLMNVFSSNKDKTNKNLAIFLENLSFILSDKLTALVKKSDSVELYKIEAHMSGDNALFYCKLVCDGKELIDVGVNIHISDKKIYRRIDNVEGLSDSTVVTFRNEITSASKELGYEIVE